MLGRRHARFLHPIPQRGPLGAPAYLRQAHAQFRLQMLLRGQNLLGYRHYEDTVVDRFVDKAAENGMDVFRVFDALNDIRNLRRFIAAVRRTGKHAQGTICYTISPLHTITDFVEMAERLMDLRTPSLCTWRSLR